MFTAIFRRIAITLLLPGASGIQNASLPAQAARPADHFQWLDKNGDGVVTRDELPRPGLSGAADADKDGQLTKAEVAACLSRSAPSQRPLRPAPAAAGYLQTEHALTVDGRERTCIVQTPKNPAGKLPVVFFFHGGGGQGSNMAASGFRDMVAREGFLAVYPQAWKSNWNDGRQSATIASQVDNVDDEKFVRAIVDDLASRRATGRSRVFATGVSNGGIFSHFLAVKAADLFAGIAPMIGGLAEPLAERFEPSHPISLLVIQGDADPLVPINGGGIAGRDRRGRIISTDVMLAKYLAHNGITGEPAVTTLPDMAPDDGTVTVAHRYPPGRNGARVEYYLVKGGGHTMPGVIRGLDRESLVGKTSRDFNAFEVIWQFFKSCPPRNLPGHEP